MKMSSPQIAMQGPPRAVSQGMHEADLVQSRENRRSYLMSQALRSALPRKEARPPVPKAPKMAGPTL